MEPHLDPCFQHTIKRFDGIVLMHRVLVPMKNHTSAHINIPQYCLQQDNLEPGVYTLVLFKEKEE